VTRDPSASLTGISTGDAVVAEVDYALRRKVAPNHTMTHVLNFALRDVLGSGVEQKGSSVTHERLRY
jgi:alanyl-tRNA synthetase